MAQIRMAHVRIQGIDVGVFAANARDDTDTGRAEVLVDLTMAARAQGLRIDKAALAYGNRFYGAPDLVRYLAGGGPFRWTHTLSV